MGMKPDKITKIDADGRLIIPPEVAEQFGLLPNSPVQLIMGENEIRISRSIHHLARVYVEPTNTCNLNCVTCMRNVWKEPSGFMSEKTYDRILEGVEKLTPRPTVFFGGFGEPLMHPRIIEMIRQAKALGAPVELISNGVLLSEKMIVRLLEAELDMLWVSLDGASPESYEDVRLGATLPQVIANLERLPYLRYRGSRLKTSLQLGIAFVAMKRNIADLPKVLALGARLGAKKFSVSNVMAHTDELRQEVLYRGAMYNGPYQFSDGHPRVNLPRIDVNEYTQGPLAEVQRGNYSIQVNSGMMGQGVYTCPFVEKGSLAVRWDGAVSPCLPLMHTFNSFLDNRPRRSYAYDVGSVLERDLLGLWEDPQYVALRQRLQSFEFSPCTDCNCCELPEENREDCLGNTFPACSGCLWAAGLIQCP